MKPPQFTFVRAASVDEACDLLAEHGDQASILAGGQSLMPLLNMRLAAPTVVIDVNRIPALDGIAEEDGALVIGATSRHADVMTSPLVGDRAPVIAAALRHVAHPAIRNHGTFGGSVAFAHPAAELPACCIALEAEIILQSTSGTRSVSAEDFFHGTLFTERRADEMVIAVRIPVPLNTRQYVFDEIARRQGDFALAGLVAAGHPTTHRFVFFGVADKPFLARQLGSVSAGTDPAAIRNEAIIEALDADLEETGMEGEDAILKRHLAGVLAARGVSRLNSTADSKHPPRT